MRNGFDRELRSLPNCDVRTYIEQSSRLGKKIVGRRPTPFRRAFQEGGQANGGNFTRSPQPIGFRFWSKAFWACVASTKAKWIWLISTRESQLRNSNRN